MIFSIIGPPGSGKTTQSKVLGEKFGLPVVQVGELLRSKLASRVPLSEKIERAMKRGEIVPSNIVKRVIMEWVKKNYDKRGFILDGFPRRLKDANLLYRQILPALGVEMLPYIGAINLEIPLKTVLKRISIRGKVEGRRFDESSRITIKRYRFHLKQKPKLKEFYSKTNRWFELSGNGKVGAIQQKIEDLVIERSKFLNLQVILFLGAAGSGKDTQAQKLESFGYKTFSSGEAFRREIALGTKIGNLIKERYMNVGKLVPDRYHKDVIYKQIAELLGKGKKLVLTGVVRTILQAKRLDEYLALRGDVIKHVVLLDVPKRELIKRLSLRRVCPKCGFNYHLKFLPPKREGFCDKDGAKLVQREDETPQAIRTRLKEQFYEVINPIIAYYKKTNRLHIIDGSPSPEKVAESVRAVLGI